MDDFLCVAEDVVFSSQCPKRSENLIVNVFNQHYSVERIIVLTDLLLFVNTLKVFSFISLWLYQLP